MVGQGNDKEGAGATAKEDTSELQKKAVTAVEVALRKSRGTTIVHLEGFDQGAVADQLHFRHFVSSASDLLEDPSHHLPPNEPTTWVITGYSSRFYADLDTEKRLQNVIRAEWNKRGRDKLNIIVLSESLPDPSFMLSNLPWFNGPFDADSIYSVRANQDSVELTGKKAKEEIYRDENQKVRVRHEWIDQETVSL